MQNSELKILLKQIRDQIQKNIIGQEKLIDEALACLLAQGHFLVTGVPGLAKTSLVRTLAKQLHLSFGRIQCTPDLLPSDITGSEILQTEASSQKREFKFIQGPIFVNMLLVDEINRASPRTQSALLEAMQERSCTVGGVSHPLEEPFMVFATQNPIESEGTFVLPEAQLDRFLIHAHIKYPDFESERKILQEHSEGTLLNHTQEGNHTDSSKSPSVTKQEILEMMKAVRSVKISGTLIEFVTRLVRSTRPEDVSCPDFAKTKLRFGAGPRAGLSLVSASKSFAFLEGADEVSWRHIERASYGVLRHRLALKLSALREAWDHDKVIDSLIQHFKKSHEKELLGYE